VAEVGGLLSGFASCEVFEDALHVWELAVAFEAQGRGAGRALMEAAVAEARRRACPAVTLTTFRDVPWNAPFYRSLGFAEIPEAAFNARLAFIREREGKAGLHIPSRCAMRLELERRD